MIRRRACHKRDVFSALWVLKFRCQLHLDVCYMAFLSLAAAKIWLPLFSMPQDCVLM